MDKPCIMCSGSLLIAQGLTGHCSVIASASRAFIFTGHLFITTLCHTESITPLLTVRHNRRNQTRPVFAHQCLWGGMYTCQRRMLWCGSDLVMGIIALLTLSLMAALSCYLPTAWTLVLKSLFFFFPLITMMLTLFSITFNLGCAVKHRLFPIKCIWLVQW